MLLGEQGGRHRNSEVEDGAELGASYVHKILTAARNPPVKTWISARYVRSARWIVSPEENS
jgi:hypothetical protein